MTIRTAKITLTLIWIALSIPLLLILILRQLLEVYSDPKAVWAWASQFIFPNLTLIGGAWSATVGADEDKPISSVVVAGGAIVLSVFYLVVLYLVLAVQMLGDQLPEKVFEQSGLFLGTIQALVVGWLGKFFIDNKR